MNQEQARLTLLENHADILRGYLKLAVECLEGNPQVAEDVGWTSGDADEVLAWDWYHSRTAEADLPGRMHHHTMTVAMADLLREGKIVAYKDKDGKAMLAKPEHLPDSGQDSPQ